MNINDVFGDVRQDLHCLYCGDVPTTREHIPSKVLLNDPFPNNLFIVEACQRCNQEFSLDEEYFACALECIRVGSAELKDIQRDKVRRVLAHHESLRQRLNDSFNADKSEFNIEVSRFDNVITKLAKCHIRYENHDPAMDKPTTVVWRFVSELSSKEIDNFLSPIPLTLLPEVGSRLLNRVAFRNDLSESIWITVQPNVYSYCVAVGVVRINFHNFLFAEINWN
jgi:hypothetical protein